jgi:hypothetical protein
MLLNGTEHTRASVKTEPTSEPESGVERTVQQLSLLTEIGVLAAVKIENRSSVSTTSTETGRTIVDRFLNSPPDAPLVTPPTDGFDNTATQTVSRSCAGTATQPKSADLVRMSWNGTANERQ